MKRAGGREVCGANSLWGMGFVLESGKYFGTRDGYITLNVLNARLNHSTLFILFDFHTRFTIFASPQNTAKTYCLRKFVQRVTEATGRRPRQKKKK